MSDHVTIYDVDEEETDVQIQAAEDGQFVTITFDDTEFTLSSEAFSLFLEGCIQVHAYLDRPARKRTAH